MGQLGDNGKVGSKATPARGRSSATTARPGDPIVDPALKSLVSQATPAETPERALWVQESEEQQRSWEVTLLARWGRLHLLLTVIEPLLPADHPRLRLVRQTLFTTYQDLKSLGVTPQPIPRS